MLQQTQVKTVIPYYERWMRLFPTVEALARARPEKVAKAWEGLGYYRRARHAQAAAKIIVDKHGGRFPTKFEEVLELPGVGRYTAGAICSIAYGAATPILDGNVIRVLTRLQAVTGDPRDRAVNAKLWSMAQALVEATDDPSALNQGLMELGALICIPRGPNCPACPLCSACAAHRTGKVEQFPMLAKPPPATRRRFAAFVARSAGRFLVRQRPEGVVNARLWEFPNIELNAGDDLTTASAPFVMIDKAPLCQVRHSITTNRILLEAYAARVAGGRPPDGAVWRTRAELERLAFASAHRKILSAVMSGQGRAF